MKHLFLSSAVLAALVATPALAAGAQSASGATVAPTTTTSQSDDQACKQQLGITDASLKNSSFLYKFRKCLNDIGRQRKSDIAQQELKKSQQEFIDIVTQQFQKRIGNSKGLPVVESHLSSTDSDRLKALKAKALSFRSRTRTLIQQKQQQVDNQSASGSTK